MYEHTVSLAIAALFITSPLAAQSSWVVQPGARVRVTAPALHPATAVGTVMALRGDTIWLLEQGARDSLAFAGRQITRLEVPDGKSGHALWGAGIGLVAGVSIGVVTAHRSAAGGCLSLGDNCPGNDTITAFLGIASGIIGALLGAAVGALIRSEVWAPAPIGAVRASLLVRPLPKGGTGLGLALKL